jgi:hypothetical protein
MDISVRGKTPRAYDQFFTNDTTARMCVDSLFNQLKVPVGYFDIVLEPSCGEGAFVKCLGGAKKLIYMDIDAADPTIRMDFMTFSGMPRRFFHRSGKRSFGTDDSTERAGTCITIGNPPFGKNSTVAVDFFNRAAAFSDIIAFIVPKTFIKDSVKDRLDRHLFLVWDEPIKDESFIFEGKPTTVPCVFQIWVHCDSMHLLKVPVGVAADKMRPLSPRLTKTDDFTFVKVDESPDIIIRRVGVLAGKIFTTDLHKWTTKNHYFIKITDSTRKQQVIQNLIDLDLEHLPAKDATAGMGSISITEMCKAYNERYKKAS